MMNLVENQSPTSNNGMTERQLEQFDKLMQEVKTIIEEEKSC